MIGGLNTHVYNGTPGEGKSDIWFYSKIEKRTDILISRSRFRVKIHVQALREQVVNMAQAGTKGDIVCGTFQKIKPHFRGNTAPGGKKRHIPRYS